MVVGIRLRIFIHKRKEDKGGGGGGGFILRTVLAKRKREGKGHLLLNRHSFQPPAILTFHKPDLVRSLCIMTQLVVRLH